MEATETRELESTDSPETLEIKPQTAEMIVSLASQARALRGPALCCAGVSLGAAVIVWLFSYAAFVADSPVSTVVCLAILAFLLAPGLLLLWVYLSLKGVMKLPARLRLPSQPLPGGAPSSPAEAGSTLYHRLKTSAQRRASAIFEVWTLLGYFDSLKSLGGPNPFLAFMSKPVSQIFVGLALLASAFLLVLALFEVLRGVLGLLF